MSERTTDQHGEGTGPPPPSLVARRPRLLQWWLPVLGWLPRYQARRDLPRDLLAGAAVAALVVPESLGYARVAGVPAEVGLYAALGALVAYSLTGGLSILVVGPASAVAAVSGVVVADLGGDDPLVITSALAITTGVLLAVAGALRLGWIVNFISRPVLHAFVAGLAISIVIGQADSLVGIEVAAASPLLRAVELVRNVGDWHGLTVALGLGSLAVILASERLAERLPAALFVVTGTIVLSAIAGLADSGVAVVGELPRGLPDIGLPDLSGTRWAELLAASTAILLVGFSEGYAAGSAVADRTGEDVDPDQELVGSGVANLAAGLAGGMVVSGSLSRSAAAATAGARTQVANLFAAGVVLATLVFLAPVFEDLPDPALAAVVIAAVLPAASPRPLIALWEVNRLDFAAALVTFVLVLTWETLPALICGVLLSLAFLVHRASFPDVVELRPMSDGHLHPSGGDGELDGHAEVAVMRFEAPLVYTNAERFADAIDALVARRAPLRRLVVDAEMISDLDATGAETLERVDDSLAEGGIELALARFHDRARAQLERSRLATRFDGRLHATVRDAAGPWSEG